MNRNFRFSAFSVLLISASMLAVNVSADDAVAQKNYDDAIALFAQRADLAKNDQVIGLLDQAMKQNPGPELAYRILIFASHANYWKGNNQSTDAARMSVFQKAMDAAESARKLNDDYADAYYWYSLALGKWCLAKGVLASLSRKSELIQHAEAAIERQAQDGSDGAAIDFWGPNRVLGRMYFKLPGFAGGSREKTLQYLSEGYGRAPNHVLNVSYYAEALNEGTKAEKAQARGILDQLIAAFERDPVALNPDRVPESAQEMSEARQVRKEIGN